jgi:peptidoglycan/LPS O-acetylase OafA/YrhL
MLLPSLSASWRGGWLVLAAAVLMLSTLPVENRHMHTWGLTVLYLGAGYLVAKAIAFEGSAPIRITSGLLARIGVYSYSIYLWHLFFQRILAHFHIASPTLTFCCYLAGAILFGIAAAKAIEIPVLRFRDRVFPRMARISTAPKDLLPTEELVKAQALG